MIKSYRFRTVYDVTHEVMNGQTTRHHSSLVRVTARVRILHCEALGMALVTREAHAPDPASDGDDFAWVPAETTEVVMTSASGAAMLTWSRVSNFTEKVRTSVPTGAFLPETITGGAPLREMVQ